MCVFHNIDIYIPIGPQGLYCSRIDYLVTAFSLRTVVNNKSYE